MKKTPNQNLPKIKEICQDLESLLSLLEQNSEPSPSEQQENERKSGQRALLQKIKTQISELS